MFEHLYRNNISEQNISHMLNIQILKKMKKKHISWLYIAIIIAISIVLIVERILFYFIDINLLPDSSLLKIIIIGRDADYHLIHGMMVDGIANMYVNNMPYLYFWYFIFFPVYILPIEIGVYIWDILRLISIIFVAKNLQKITKDNRDLYFFYILSIFGYLVDMSLNNNNWLILMLLLESYLFLEKDNKIVSGILWSLATYKIIGIIFPVLLILTKKIKLKDIFYYVLPFAIICIPYCIFPEYTMQLFHNWSASTTPNIIARILWFLWQLSQTAQLLFMSFLGYVLLIGIENYEKLEPYNLRIKILVFCVFFFLYLIFAPLSLVIFYLLSSI